jgi:RNA polymerase sigma-70 factor (ECF subfamily)
LTERSNSDWLSDLGSSGTRRESAIADIRAVLVRSLGYALRDRTNVHEDDIEDFAQDALLRILDNLESFRAESRFTTWAQAIAVRVAFSALRRRRWRDFSLDRLTENMDGDFSPRFMTDPGRSPEDQAMLAILWARMRRIIGEELTKKQRDALVAVRFQGMPLEEVARSMDTNRNALYKLLHDARKRLRERMMAEGISPDDLLETLGA